MTCSSIYKIQSFTSTNAKLRILYQEISNFTWTSPDNHVNIPYPLPNFYQKITAKKSCQPVISEVWRFTLDVRDGPELDHFLVWIEIILKKSLLLPSLILCRWDYGNSCWIVELLSFYVCFINFLLYEAQILPSIPCGKNLFWTHHRSWQSQMVAKRKKTIHTKQVII